MRNETPRFYYFYLRYKNKPRKNKIYLELATAPEFKRR